MATRPVRRETSRALSRAFSSKVEPVSSTSGRSGKASRPTTRRPKARSGSSSSRTLPLLRVARTMVTGSLSGAAACSLMSAPCALRLYCVPPTDSVAFSCAAQCAANPVLRQQSSAGSADRGRRFTRSVPVSLPVSFGPAGMRTAGAPFGRLSGRSHARGRAPPDMPRIGFFRFSSGCGIRRFG